ncbi:MAG: UDP-N-acetylmuramoyl-L-alanyl-D-glutamate--2,6-diaminopimelate ligase [Phycisphaerales bacterium]|nr:UDP-N-acetylmuramoyl-L-alanyl-D-glutamate--2,6-diaminopimelate ligase [Phycisphaerales bacterium]
MKLGDLVANLPTPVSLEGDAGVRVCDLTEDSRTVVPHSLFIARKGLKADGRVFARDAVGAGAVAILTDDPALAKAGLHVPVAVAPDITLASALVAERFYRDPTSRLSIVGVTGTNGKTTITYLIWQLLNHLHRRCGMVGTVQIDDGVTLGPAVMTTPPAIEISRTFSLMADAGCRAAAIEASSHALDQRRLDATRMCVGVFTNLTGDHLDYHKTMENYAQAKARLFEMLPPSGVAIVNADDPWHTQLIRDCRATAWKCSLGNDADCTCRVVSADMGAMRIELRGPWGVIEQSVNLIGRHNQMNVLQAVASAWALRERVGGFELHDLVNALAEVKAPPGRLEPAAIKSKAALPRVFVDYAHSDDSLRNVLIAVRKAMTPSDGKLWVVFGCGGDRDRTKRPRMGAAAIELADSVVVTSDNPRSEEPMAIIREITQGVPGDMRARVLIDPDRRAAIHAAIAKADARDIIVIAGKGHETEQITLGANRELVKHHFDDREVAREALEARAGSADVKSGPALRSPTREAK